MGLDWNPLGKPRIGYEHEFEELFHVISGKPLQGGFMEKLKRIVRPVNVEAARERWFQIQISPFETVGALQVGRDPTANAWATAHYEKKPPEDKSLDEFLESLNGYYVVALAPPCDGIPFYSNGPAGYVELFSFRAQFLTNDCQDFLGKKLVEQCYESCGTSSLAALGKELYRKASEYALLHDVSQVEHIYELEAEDGTPEAKAHIAFSAAKWCAYWSSRGHGLEAYF